MALERCASRVTALISFIRISGGTRKMACHTVVDLSVIDKTHARLSSVRVRIVSVRALSKERVRAVSYVAVKLPRVLYQAN